MNNNSSGNRTLAFICGFLFGAVLGGGLALLFAPGRGEETRKKLKKSGEEIKEKIGEIYEDVREAGEPLLSAVEEFEPVARETAEMMAEAAPKIKDEVLERVSAVSSNLASTRKRFFKNTHR